MAAQVFNLLELTSWLESPGVCACRAKGKDTWVRGSYRSVGSNAPFLNSSSQSQHPSLRPVGLPARGKEGLMKLKTLQPQQRKRLQ